MALLDDVADFLVAQSTAFSIGSTSATLAKAIALDEPKNPSTISVLYETGGQGNAYTFSSSTGYANVASESPGFQILSRSTAYTTARSYAETAYQLLDGLAGRTLPTSTGGTYYEEIAAVQAPFYLQRDANDRYIISCNYLTSKERHST